MPNASAPKHAGLDPLFTPNGYREFADDLLERMTNPFLVDMTERVTRDTERKLGWNDRLVVTMRMALKQEIKPCRYSLGAAAALAQLDPATLEGQVPVGSILDTLWQEVSPLPTERDRLVDRIQVAQSQPAHLARTALLKRIYGRHPYAVQTPEPDQVRAVRPPALRKLHAERVHPAGAVLVLVGDVHPDRALDAAEQALSGWDGAGGAEELPPAPPLEPGPLLLAIDRERAARMKIAARRWVGGTGHIAFLFDVTRLHARIGHRHGR